ncbi:pilus assembly protein TadG-related protein [Streptomyces sp. NPDC001851]|uniref:pilus assembly protein TadG-related protein n=1 Tax=Streptomyces sp. NPDC001851 TaxID=3154529 RepID=UPI0033193ECA
MIPPHRDEGQAFPIYITVVAGLLLLALAYLAVGQAAVNRSGAQTAADAAALAAAQDERVQLTDQWGKVLRDPEKWQDIFDGSVPLDHPGTPCRRAGQLAVLNDASLNNCSPSGLLKYRVDVQTNKSVGRSVVPGSENHKSTASAVAEVQHLCTFTPPDEGAKGDELPALTCKGGKVWHLKPDDTTGLPKPEDLFDVHLANSPANDQ